MVKNKWHFETFKRLVDNLEFRVYSQRYFRKKPNKRVTWFKSYYRISKTIYLDRDEIDYSWRDFIRKLNNRFYQKFQTSDWTNPIKRICDREYERVDFRLSTNEITYMTEKVYRVSSLVKSRVFQEDWSSAIKSVCDRIQKSTISDMKLDRFDLYHDSVQILINRLYWAYGYEKNLEKIAVERVNSMSV